MALVFPPYPKVSDAVPARGAGETVGHDVIAAHLDAALDEEWWILRDRTIGGESVPFEIMHRRHGIAIATPGAERHEIIPALRRLLDEQGFSRTFRGTLPIVAVEWGELGSGTPGDAARSGFCDAPTLSVDDPDWVEW